MDNPDAEELHYRVRMEAPAGTLVAWQTPGDFTPAPLVDIECGLNGWKKYTSTTILTDIDTYDEIIDEQTYASHDVLVAWLEQYMATRRAEGYIVVSYKINGMNVDWIEGKNLPPDPDLVVPEE